MRSEKERERHETRPEVREQGLGLGQPPREEGTCAIGTSSGFGLGLGPICPYAAQHLPPTRGVGAHFSWPLSGVSQLSVMRTHNDEVWKGMSTATGRPIFK
jgi:hypothetical protein